MNWKVTRDQKEIIDWAEKNNGRPMSMDYVDAKADEVGLRIDFPGARDDIDLNKGRIYKYINWEEFFRIFNREKLSFEYLDGTPEDPDWGYRFIKTENLKI